MTVQLPKAFGFLFKPSRYKVAYGGRGSAKSHSFAITLLLLGMTKPLFILCAREFQNSIKDSVHKLLSDKIGELKLDGFYSIQKNYIIGQNGTTFLFEGLKMNTQSIKSYEGIDICWVEEANYVSEDSLNILIPTIRKENSEIWFSFNPDLVDDPVFKRFVANQRPDALVRKVSWRDNPWFSKAMKAELDWDRSSDPDKYSFIWEGELRKSSSKAIFSGKYSIRPVPEATKDTIFYIGADWGYAADPAAVIRCWIDHPELPQLQQTLYIDKESYGVKVEIDNFPQMMDAVLPKKEWPVTCDSQKPEMVSHLNRRGYNCYSAQKGAGSVERGIKFLRNFKEIVIDPKCTHTCDEFRLYSYKIDPKTNDILPVIVDAHNHLIDSLRYATEKLQKATNLTETGASVLASLF
jgi:phage terminase large subunit